MTCAGARGRPEGGAEDCAEIVRMLLRLSPRARVPQVVVERLDGEGEVRGA